MQSLYIYQQKLLSYNLWNSSFFNQLTNSVAPEPEGSWPHSQQPTKDPYPAPV
jgi:hypothetical protein